MRPNEHSRGYLPTLDGWRFFAIAGVLMAHAPDFPNWMHLHRFVQMKGPLGVNLFFAISGFLICSRMMGEEATRGRISLKNFYIRRAFRILPPAATYLLVIALLAGLHQIPWDTPSWFGALFFFRNYLHYFYGANAQNWFTSHFWSLSIEEHFYFLLPAIVFFFPLRRKAILLALSTLSFLWLGWFLYIRGGYGIPFWGQRTEFSLPLLMVPAWFALWMQTPANRDFVQRRLTVPVGLLLGAIATQLCSMALPKPFYELPQFLLATLYPLMIISTTFHPENAVSRFLELPALKYVGRLSYSLYLWQELFFSREHPYAEYHIHFLQRPGINLLCTFACAMASYYLVEKPFIRLGQRLTRQRNAVPPSEPIPPVAAPAPTA